MHTNVRNYRTGKSTRAYRVCGLITCFHCVPVELSAVIKLDIGKENTALNYPHIFSLQSPTFPAPRSDTCLTVEYTSEVDFAVKIACLSAERVVDVDVLRRSAFQMGLVLNRMNLVIADKSADYEKCVLIIDISARKSGVVAAISNITLTEGTCVYPGLFCFFIYFVCFFPM